MKKSSHIVFLLSVLSLFGLLQACVDAEDLATPNVPSPVLVLVEGTAFAATSPVSVNSRFLELDKTNILNNSIGIDSIPVPNLGIKVFINTTTEVASFTTGTDGTGNLSVSWEDLGLSSASSGSQVRLEFAGTYKSIPFRKYHTVRVE